MASVFLSYSREDAAKAEAIAMALERRGHSVWWDRRLQGGSRFSHEIEEALKGSDSVLVLWSHSSVKSAWVQDEASEGRDSGRLVPVLIDETKPPLGFRQYQAIDLCGWKGRESDPAVEQVHYAITAKANTAEQAKPPAEPRSRRRDYRLLFIAAAGFAIVAATAVIYWLASPATQADPAEFRLRLGTFSALSQDVPQTVPETLREELLAALGTDAAIVATTTREGSQTATGFALNASVRKVEEVLRFTVHVTNEATGGSVWSETLDRPAAPDIAPRQIAVAVSQILRCGLGGAAAYGKSMPDETLSIYFNFCEEFWAETMGRDGNNTRALDLGRRLTDAAPDFSRAWSGLANVALWASRDSRAAQAETLRSEARKAAERALELDDENNQAYQVLTSLQPAFAHSAREELHLKSVSVRPSDCGCEFLGYGEFLGRVGRNSEAVDAFKRAHDMIPLSASVNSGWAEALFVAGRPDEARRVVDDVLKFWPENAHLREMLVRTAFWTGKYDEALALLSDPRTPVTQREREALRSAFLALKSGSPAARSSASKGLQDVSEQASINAPLVITALAALGADQEALSVAARRIQVDGPPSLRVLFEPALADARRLPQFERLADRFGLLSYWRQNGHVPDFCSEPSPPSVCGRLQD
ncbi:MAG TPA: TIR domain-containing protein [Allosphingosinicella sp.]|nr:TIR domain-containing protein [Allosphingosinicella sp.]